MTRTGDRVIVEGVKVGDARREGTLVDQVGRMIKVRWSNGEESLLTPAPGSVHILPANSGSRSRVAASTKNRKAAKTASRTTPKRTNRASVSGGSAKGSTSRTAGRSTKAAAAKSSKASPKAARRRKR